MFEKLWNKKTEGASSETPKTEFTTDETGAVVSQEMAAADKKFKEERE